MYSLSRRNLTFRSIRVENLRLGHKPNPSRPCACVARLQYRYLLLFEISFARCSPRRTTMPVNQETAVRTVRQMWRLPWSQGGSSCLSLIPIVRTTVQYVVFSHYFFRHLQRCTVLLYFIRTEYTYTVCYFASQNKCYSVQCPLFAVFMMCTHNMLFVSYTLSLVLALKASENIVKQYTTLTKVRAHT